MRYLFALALSAAPALGLAQPTAKKSAAYDFVIVDQDCKTMTAVLVPLESKKTDLVASAEGTKSNMYCSRVGARAVRCEDPNTKQTKLEYEIKIDTVALLRLADTTSSEVIWINPGQHTAITSTRTFDTFGDADIPYVGMKMCKGIYFDPR